MLCCLPSVLTLHRGGEDGDFVEDEYQDGFGKESVVRYVTRRGVARGFIMLKPMENYGYFTFQIANNKCADQTARMRRLICALLFASNKVSVSRFEAHMMVKPRHPGPRLATCLNFKLDSERNRL